MIRIKITPLTAGVHHFTFQPSAGEIELDPERFKDIQVDVRLEKGVDRILVNLNARATATLECDRTLVLFDQPVSGTYTLLYAPPELAEDAADTFGEIRVWLPNDQEIDVSDAVRDTLLLALPSRAVAPGAEDAEIPTRFGTPRTDGEDIDPRWEALRKLKTD